MEKPKRRLKVLANKLEMSDTQLAMCILYSVTHDKVYSWCETVGKNSKSKHRAQLANTAFNTQCIKDFLLQIGGVIAWDAEQHLTFRGNNKPATKQIVKHINEQIFNESKGAHDLGQFDKIDVSVNKLIGLKGGGTNAARLTEHHDKMAGEKKENDFPSINTNDIHMSADMSRAEFLDYLIQEQGKSKTQKDKNSFTLRIHEHMNFKEDKNDELRPILYLPFRFEDIGLCDKCSSLIRSFTK